MEGTYSSSIPLNAIKDVMVALHRCHVDHTLLWNDTAPFQGNAEAVAPYNTHQTSKLQGRQLTSGYCA